MNINKAFLEAIKKSTLAYNTYGPRSNEKIKPLHGFIARHLATIFPASKGYKIEAYGYTENEGQAKTGFGDTKDIDIKISRYGVDLGYIMVKYICSSYGKNAKNYVENMTGETASLHHVKNTLNQNVLVWQLIVLPEYLPVFDKDKKIKCIEKITDSEINRYTAVKNFKHTIDKPDVLTLCMIDTGNYEYLKNAKENNISIELDDRDFMSSYDINFSSLKNFDTKKHSILTESYKDSFEYFVKLLNYKIFGMNIRKKIFNLPSKKSF